jgi:alpha-tubulin suppressor-like RCC1 family protein
MRATICVVVALGACFSKPPFTGLDEREMTPRLAAGRGHTCRIDADTTLVCWGNNDQGQLGHRADDTELSTPAPAVEGEWKTGWTAVAAGATHTCGVRDGKVACWGDNRYLQSNPSVASIVAEPAVLDVPGDVERIYAGNKLSCAINSEGEAYCWGALDFEDGVPEIQRLTAHRFQAIAIGAEHACAIAAGDDSAGQVWCWGSNEKSQLGSDSPNATFDAPVPVDTEARFHSIAAALDSTCGTTIAGALMCWGSPEHGALGPSGSAELVNVVDDSQGWRNVTMGRSHVCALSNERLFCYGDNDHGALGRGTYTPSRVLPPEPIAITGSSFLAIAAGDDHTCALTKSTEQASVETWCWGSNSFGELGQGTVARKLVPTRVKLQGKAEEIVAGDDHTCARVTLEPNNKAVYCWGLNVHEQAVPQGPTPSVGEPLLVSSEEVAQLAAGRSHTCIRLRSNNAVTCWGSDENGQITNLSMLPSSKFIAAGGDMTCSIADDGILSCRGRLDDLDDDLNLGIETMHIWHSVSIGTSSVIGVVTGTGTSVDVIGFGRPCELGQGSSPTAIPMDDPVLLAGGRMPGVRVTAAHAGGHHSCLQYDDEAKCMGDNTQGQLGTVDTSESCSNVSSVIPLGQAGAPFTERQIVAAADHTCALLSDGKLKCWGNNDVGELGMPLGQRLPTPVYETWNWKSITAGRVHMCGISASGDVFCWGENQYGAIGDGSHFAPKPVQVP